MRGLGGGRRLARTGIVAAVLASVLTAVGGQPASAAAPVLTVTPTTVQDGDQVTVHAEGADPTHDLFIGICPRSYAEGPDHTDAKAHCIHRALGAEGVADAVVTVHDTNEGWYGEEPITCSALVDGCVVAAYTQAVVDGPILEFVAVPITVVLQATSIATSTPSVVNGGSVEVALSGFDEGRPGAIGACPASVTSAAQVSQCSVLAEHPAGLPATTTLAVPHQSPAADGSSVVCDPGCRLAAWTIGEVGPPVTADVIAFTPFDVEPPVVTADPNRQVADGATVTVRLERFTPGNVSVRQCLAVTPVKPDPRGCTPPATVTVPASGEAEAPLVYREAFTSETGLPWDCFSRCEVVVSTDDGPKPYLAALSSRPVAMSIYRDQWTTGIVVGLFAFPGTSASVAQCQVGVVHCSPPTTATLDAWGDGSVVLDQLSTYVAVDGTAVDCRTSDCVIAAFDGDGDNVDARGITYGPATLVLTPATDLHDGDAISGVVRGVDPGRLLQVTTCRRGTEAVFVRCGASTGTVTSDAIGRAELDTTAVQRFTTFAPARNQLCRDQCSIALVSPSGSVVAEAPYSMAVPSVSASPATGLGDGDAVTVAGSDLQPTYDGPTVLFPTGGWAVVQCDVAVGVNPSIVQLFEQCAVAPGGASVVVAGSTSSTAVTAQATISKILGGTTDCAASPGACVVGLARWEQDASTSTVFTPLTFG